MSQIRLLISIFAFGLLIGGSANIGRKATTPNNEVCPSNYNSSVSAPSATTMPVAQQTAKQRSPVALVKELYGLCFDSKQDNVERCPLHQDPDRALLSKFFTKHTTNLIVQDSIGSNRDQSSLFDT